jgi:hypothetical protein
MTKYDITVKLGYELERLDAELGIIRWAQRGGGIKRVPVGWGHRGVKTVSLTVGT